MLDEEHRADDHVCRRDYNELLRTCTRLSTQQPPLWDAESERTLKPLYQEEDQKLLPIYISYQRTLRNW